MLISSGLRLSPMRTSEVTLCPPSLMEAAAICECSSIMPGVRYLPVPSIIRAPAAEDFYQRQQFYHCSNNTSVFCNMPSFSLVQTVAFLISMVSCLGAVLSVQPKGKKGYVILPNTSGFWRAAIFFQYQRIACLV